MNYIKEKVDAGADFIITQMFFDPAVYASYIKACRDRCVVFRCERPSPRQQLAVR